MMNIPTAEGQRKTEPVAARPMKDGALEISYVVRYKTAHLSPTAALAAIMEQLINLPPPTYIRMKTGLAEVLNNIALHAPIKGAPACTVEIIGDGKRLCCAITDTGKPAPPHFYLHRPQAPDWRNEPDQEFLPEYGFGRRLIHACFDRIRYKAGAKENILIVELLLTARM